MADGYIEFSTTLDNSDLEKQLKDAERKVDSLKKKIEEKTTERNAIAEQMQKASEEVESTRRLLEKLQQRYDELKASSDPAAAARRSIVAEEIDKAYKLLEKQHEAADKLEAKWDELGNTIEDYENKLEGAQSEYVELGNEAQRQAAKSNNVFTKASTGIGNAMNSLSSRVSSFFKQLSLVALAVGALRALKNAISDITADNQQLNASIDNLRAVMRGFLASMVNAVLPTVIRVVNTLAAVFERIASFIDSFFGTNITGSIAQQRAAMSSNDAAKATNNQAKAARNLAKAQKEANKQLLSFDELNMMTADSSDDAADAVDDYAGDIGGGWMDSFVPDFGVFQQVLDWLDEIRRRIETDVEGPFARIREGLTLIKQGWDEIIQGIQTGDWGLVWHGVSDIVVGTCYAIEGAFGALMDWLDEMTGGRFHEIFEGLKTTLHGVVEYIEGVFRGDIELQAQGLQDIVTGLADTLRGLVNNAAEDVKMLVSGLFTWLREKFPEIGPLLDFVEGAILGTIDGIKSLITGAIGFVENVLRGAIDIVCGIFTGNGDRIVRGLKSIVNGFIDLLNGALSGVEGFFNWIGSGISSILNWLVPGGGWHFSIGMPRIPYLANGAVIPPNRQFLAVLGDQKSGNNIEAPEGLIRQIVRDEAGSQLASSMTAALMQLAPMLTGGDVNLTLYVDGEELARATNRGNASLVRRGAVKTEMVFG